MLPGLPPLNRCSCEANNSRTALSKRSYTGRHTPVAQIARVSRLSLLRSKHLVRHKISHDSPRPAIRVARRTGSKVRFRAVVCASRELRYNVSATLPVMNLHKISSTHPKSFFTHPSICNGRQHHSLRASSSGGYFAMACHIRTSTDTCFYSNPGLGFVLIPRRPDQGSRPSAEYLR